MKSRINTKGFSHILIMVGIVVGVALIIFFAFKISKSLNKSSDTSSETEGQITQENESSTFSRMNSTNNTVKKNTPVFRVSDNESGPSTTTEDTEEDTIPDENDAPEVSLVTDGIENETLSSDDPVYLIATVTDSVGGVSYVEFYINDDKKTAIEPRNLYTSSASGWDSDDANEATELAMEHIRDKYSDTDLSYLYRKYNKFDTDESECDDINEGYILIILGRKYLYDIRVSEDLDDLEVCYKGKSLNYNNKYVYLFTDDADDYEFYVKAYDIYGVETKSEEIEFELD